MGDIAASNDGIVSFSSSLILGAQLGVKQNIRSK